MPLIRRSEFLLHAEERNGDAEAIHHAILARSEVKALLKIETLVADEGVESPTVALHESEIEARTSVNLVLALIGTHGVDGQAIAETSDLKHGIRNGESIAAEAVLDVGERQMSLISRIADGLHADLTLGLRTKQAKAELLVALGE